MSIYGIYILYYLIISFVGSLNAGDNVNGMCESGDAAKTMNMAFAPAIEAKIPWVAILGNHDQESDMTRETMMKHIVKMPYTLSEVNPFGSGIFPIDGFGNYNLQIEGPFGSPLFFKSLLNVYMLDGGDYVKLDGFAFNYDWVKSSQVNWYEHASKWLEVSHKNIVYLRKKCYFLYIKIIIIIFVY